MEFFQEGRIEGGNFDAGIEAALQRVLTDVEFIYRGEHEPAGRAAGKSYHIRDLELASRLSFFLWSSIPDDELIDIAARGTLRTPGVLEKEVRRMLADPKSAALVDNFTGQWLNVRGLKSVEPVVNIFPDFDDNLRNAFQREAELFFDAIVHEDKSALDLLTADFTYVNERLAKHYGIPNVYGSQFRRVTLPPELDMRRGLLGKGALLTVTSNAAHLTGRTRKVVPDDVPRRRAARRRPAWTRASRRRVVQRHGRQPQDPDDARHQERHHQNPVCASCHKIFEPIGIAFSRTSTPGAWRTADEGSAHQTRTRR
jgi:hypothetical protein